MTHGQRRLDGNTARRTTMIPPLTPEGMLPLGRYSCTLDEVAEGFATNDHRRNLWDGFVSNLDAIRQAMGYLPAIWLAGSFTTNKPQPGDIDTCLVVDAADEGLLGAWRGAAVWLRQMGVDAYVVPWLPRPGVERGNPEREAERGYWDDHWAKCRDADPRLASIPRRGYLEVIIDGYR